MKRILIAGASGFIGKRIARMFLSRGYRVTGIGTSLTHPFLTEFDDFAWVSADTRIEGKWQEVIQISDIIINLTGQSIFHYWTKKYKQAIYDSRILTTRNIVNAIEKGTVQTLLTTSAAGIYGDCKDALLTEASASGEGFLSRVCVDWEKEAQKAKEKNVRVAVMRLGVVLGRAGALSKMLPAFKLFAGGPLGDGRHWFPWVHIKDLETAVDLIIQREDLAGVFNFSTPTPVRQKTFAKSLGRALNRPAVIPAPSFLVKGLMGELGAALLQSQRVMPEHLLDSGYSFLFPLLDDALDNLVGK